jgi:hypothetical protein
MYFDKMINELKNNNNNFNRLSKIINPFSPYFICDHFVGDEIYLYQIPIPPNKNNLLFGNYSCIKDYDIIYVQTNFFNRFIMDILNKIDKKFVLMTGQWHLPQVKRSPFTEKILNNPNIVLWISQNPIYPNSEKYIAFPYGIYHLNLESYFNALLKNKTKNYNIINLPMNNSTNPCRSKLPVLPEIICNEFYDKMADAKFIISPVGDRDDCYRHYEAIGLGTIPISNVNKYYQNIFESNMYYCDIDKMVDIINNNHIDVEYKEPNKDLVCLEYYRDKIFDVIDKIKKK